MSKRKRITPPMGIISDITEKFNSMDSTENDSTIDDTKDSTMGSTKGSTNAENTEPKEDATINATTDSTIDTTTNSTKDSSLSITIKKQENYLDKHVQRAYYIRKDLENQLIKTSKKTKVAKSELVNMALELLFENLKIEG